MGVTGLGWCGTRTSRDDELADFYEHVLGLRPVHAEPGLRVFELSDGRNVEVFGLGYPGREHFGPGRSWASPSATCRRRSRELRDAGVELLGEPGPAWQHFRGPDGNVYELTAG